MSLKQAAPTDANLHQWSRNMLLRNRCPRERALCFYTASPPFDLLLLPPRAAPKAPQLQAGDILAVIERLLHCKGKGGSCDVLKHRA